MRAFFLAAAASMLLSGCWCCESTSPPYDKVPVGGSVDFGEFTVPVCTGAATCDLRIDVVNSYRVVVRTLYRGDPEDVPPPDPIVWDTRDDGGNLVPADIYVIRAWMNNERIDSWVVLVYQ